MDELIRQKIQSLIHYLEVNRGALVIDANTHASDIENLHHSFRQKLSAAMNHYYGKPVSAGNLIQEMEMASVNMCLIWQNPEATWYGDDKDGNFESLLAANKYIFDATVNYPEQFIGAGWTDPQVMGLQNALKLIDICVHDFGFLIIKLDTAGRLFQTDSEEFLTLTDRIVEMGAIPAVCYGAETPFTSASGLAWIARRYPDHPVVAVHKGRGGAGYHDSEELFSSIRLLGLQHPNLKFVLSARRDTHIESDLINYQLAGEPFSGNLFCASGAPFSRMCWNFGGFRWMILSLMDNENHTDERIRANPGLFNEEVMRNYIGANFAIFIIDGYNKLLNAN